MKRVNMTIDETTHKIAKVAAWRLQMSVSSLTRYLYQTMDVPAILRKVKASERSKSKK